MRIDKLSLLNFRCFRQLDITLMSALRFWICTSGAGEDNSAGCDTLWLALFPFDCGFDASLYVR